MTDNLLFQLVILLALTATGLALFERLRLPAIAGFLVAGAVAGPGGLGIVNEPSGVRALAELGVVFLLFEIGLELPLERVRRLWRTALLAGSAQMLVTGAAVMGVAMALGIDVAQAFVLASVIAMSSTALVMRVLGDRGQLQAPQGHLALSILVFQDLSIVPLLLALPMIQGHEGGIEQLSFSLLKVGIALIVVFAVVRIVVPRLLMGGARRRSSDLFSLLALFVVLGSAYFAEQVGLTLAVGAFLAGLAAGDSPYSSQMFSEVIPLRGVLLGIFFTAVGMLFEPSVIAEQTAGLALYLTAAIVLKALVVVAVTLFLLRQGLRIGILTGLALAQTGEFSFVFAQDAVRAGLITPELNQIVIAGSVLSLTATPFLIRAAPYLVDAIERRRGLTSGMTGKPEAADEPHVLVVGFGPAGQTLVRLLRSLEIPYRVVEANALAVEQARRDGERITYGDATRPTVLERMGIREARLLAVAISDPFATRRIVTRAKTISPDISILARTRFLQELDTLTDSGATEVVVEEFEGSVEFAARALAFFGTSRKVAKELTDSLREKGYPAIRDTSSKTIDPRVLESLRPAGGEWIDIPEDYDGRESLAELDVGSSHGATVLSVERAGMKTRHPAPSFKPRGGDRLLAAGGAETLDELRRHFEEN